LSEPAMSSSSRCLRDENLPGRNDKLIWVVVLLARAVRRLASVVSPGSWPESKFVSRSTQPDLTEEGFRRSRLGSRDSKRPGRVLQLNDNGG
jgi:hypothetical protein